MYHSSVDPCASLRIATNLRDYFVGSPAAMARVQVLHARINHFSISTIPNNDDAVTDTTTLIAGKQYIDPELDLDHMFVIFLSAFITTVPLLCIDTRFKGVYAKFFNGPLPSCPFAADEPLLILEPGRAHSPFRKN